MEEKRKGVKKPARKAGPPEVEAAPSPPLHGGGKSKPGMVREPPAPAYAPEAKRRIRTVEVSAEPRAPVLYRSSTEAQNGFGALLDAVARGRTVMITKHSRTEAVMMSFERYEALTRGAVPELDTLSAEFDAMMDRMQTPESEEAYRSLFRASGEELGAAAVAYARRNPPRPAK